LVLATAKLWGNLGAALSYTSATGIVGLGTALWIFWGFRRGIAAPKEASLRLESAP